MFSPTSKNLSAIITGDESNSSLGITAMEEGGDSSWGRGSKESSADNPKLSPKIAVMEPVLRFLQLLCENHNLFLQVMSVFLVVFVV